MRSVKQTHLGLLIALGFLVTGCSMPEGNFPSLAKRPYENQGPVAEPPSQPPILSTILPDSLRDQLASIVARHDAADAAFRAGLPGTRQAALAGARAPAGSESWVNAEMELSRLEKKRADSLAALAEIDRLVAEERNKGADAGLVALMEPSQERVRKAVDAQTAVLAELANIIG